MMKQKTVDKTIKTILFILLTIGSLLLSGCGKSGDSAAKEQMQALYGENRRIDGDYDASLAAVCLNGVFVGREDNGIVSFKGIPYAEAPVGDLRWKDPVPAKDSTAVYEAYYFGPSPIQTEWPSEPGSYYPQSEDCLTLNVWTNTAGPTEGKTVMVFFHGGSYAWGATCDPMYDGHNLVEKYPDLVLVTVEYRLGILGFIDLSAVPGGEAFSTSGNLGLLDQICALQWIQKNIAAFGGDPDNVTIWGESAGAGSVCLLPLIDGTEGLYRRIIAESGSVNLTYSREECQNQTRMLLKSSGCSTMEELMALSEEELTELNKDLNDYNNFPERDGVVLPPDLYAAWEREELADIDILIGTNADEARYWVNEMGYTIPCLPKLFVYKNAVPILYENNIARLSVEEREAVQTYLSMQTGQQVWRLTAFYTELLFRVPAMELAVRHAENRGRTYAYYWTMPGADETLGACHAIELSYVFRNPQVTIYSGDLYNEALADTVQDMWVRFARTGDPGTEENPWEPYTGEERMTMVLGNEPHMESDISNVQRTLLTPLLGYYFNGCYSQMSLMVPHVWKLGGTVIGTVILVSVGTAWAIRAARKRRKVRQGSH